MPEPSAFTVAAADAKVAMRTMQDADGTPYVVAFIAPVEEAEPTPAWMELGRVNLELVKQDPVLWADFQAIFAAMLTRLVPGSKPMTLPARWLGGDGKGN